MLGSASLHRRHFRPTKASYPLSTKSSTVDLGPPGLVATTEPVHRALEATTDQLVPQYFSPFRQRVRRWLHPIVVGETAQLAQWQDWLRGTAVVVVQEDRVKAEWSLGRSGERDASDGITSATAKSSDLNDDASELETSGRRSPGDPATGTAGSAAAVFARDSSASPPLPAPPLARTLPKSPLSSTTSSFDLYFILTSLLGNHNFFLLFLPLIFWTGWASFARSLVLVVLGAIYISSWIKDWLCLPRPPSPPLQRLTWSPDHTFEYGFPSSHTTYCVSVGLHLIACYLGRDVVAEAVDHHGWGQQAVVAGIGLFVASIGFGRIYCGMHSVTDVLGGAVLGTAWWAAVYFTHPLLDGYLLGGHASASVTAGAPHSSGTASAGQSCKHLAKLPMEQEMYGTANYIRLVVYTGIGFLAAYGVPSLYPLIGLGLPPI
ncbi:Long-chain base-1-phosphate phosphatase [Tieghemiomyces parasiticus]|uniref:Long-chain base-1-phosphate phosphatase n=1 Tax=Tieghemiomyces parasiticus TaxID=78921 RepID=A0A9W7ZYW5_9FUNG|nr:Long-chain base-1-phosphate phosphatase [Tieghemiomyces parasiticus]